MEALFKRKLKFSNVKAKQTNKYTLDEQRQKNRKENERNVFYFFN